MSGISTLTPTGWTGHVINWNMRLGRIEMTNEEKIKALKKNEKPFGLMDKELQEKLMDCKKANSVKFGGSQWNSNDDPCWEMFSTYRLRPNYTEEPEVIELEIKKNAYGELVVIFDGNNRTYTMCPALCPMKGYRFAYYKYPDGRESGASFYMRERGNVFPTHAVYKKVEG